MKVYKCNKYKNKNYHLRLKIYFKKCKKCKKSKKYNFKNLYN